MVEKENLTNKLKDVCWKKKSEKDFRIEKEDFGIV